MRRTAVLLVMLLAMIWQSVALARPGSSVSVLADAEHAALHWQGQGHHHHVDGSVSLDDSPDAKLHLLADHASGTPALLSAISNPFLTSGATAPAGLHPSRVPDPFLDGLLRPPRAPA